MVVNPKAVEDVNASLSSTRLLPWPLPYDRPWGQWERVIRNDQNSREGRSSVGDQWCRCGYEANTSATVMMILCGRWRQVLDERRVGIGSGGPCSKSCLGDDPVCSILYHLPWRTASIVIIVFGYKDIVYLMTQLGISLIGSWPWICSKHDQF
jgi:hypothetical protein